MKSLAVILMGAFLSGCVVSGHVTPPTASVHMRAAPNTVKAWVWVGGYYTRGHWVAGHWTVRWVEPHLMHKHPHRYVKHTPQRPQARPHRHHRQNRHRRHR